MAMDKVVLIILFGFLQNFCRVLKLCIYILAFLSPSLVYVWFYYRMRQN